MDIRVSRRSAEDAAPAPMRNVAGGREKSLGRSGNAANARRYAVWLWPNLMSLDAPAVALLWQLFFLRCFDPAGRGVGGDVLPAVLLGLAVWLIYVADRTLDAWRGAGGRARHRFYWSHWRLILPVWTLALGVGCWLAATRLPGDLLARGMVVGMAAGVYLGVVHLAPRLFATRKFPGSFSGSKEGAVAVVFALGASVVVWPVVAGPFDVLAIGLFGVVCWMNCAAIEDWESGRTARVSVIAAAGAVAVLAAVVLRDDRAAIGLAEAVAALGLLLLDRVRAGSWVSVEGVRVLADVALLSPLLLLPVVGV